MPILDVTAMFKVQTLSVALGTDISRCLSPSRPSDGSTRVFRPSDTSSIKGTNPVT